MSVSMEEFKSNVDKYLQLSKNEDVLITDNNHIIAILSNPNIDLVKAAKSLFGILPNDINLDEVRDERLNKI